MKLFTHKHSWKEIGRTDHTAIYMDTEGNNWAKPEIIYQCTKCKDVIITAEL